MEMQKVNYENLNYENLNKKILVLGIGNDLLKDEGIGVHVVREMKEIGLPKEVKLVEGGVAGIDLLEDIMEAEKLIIVDAMDASDQPGSVFCFKPHEVDLLLNKSKTSLHQVDLFDTLKIARFLDCYPETVIIGIQPKDLEWGIEPTPELVSKIPVIIDIVLRQMDIN